MESDTFKIRIALLLLLAFSHASNGFTDPNKINFDRNHTMVQFKIPKNEPDFISMVKTISTRFSRIEIDSAHVSVDDFKKVLTETANFNKENKDNRTNAQRPTQLWVHLPNVNGDDLKSFRDTLESVNWIHSGSVHGLIINMSAFLHHTHNNKTNDILRLFRNPNEIASRYQIAVLINKKISSNNTKLQKTANFVNKTGACCVFAAVDPLQNTNTGNTINTSIGMIQNVMEETKRNITAFNEMKDLELVFKTGFSQPSRQGNDQFADLATYWIGMNDWAVRKNVTVSLSQAFDVPSKNNWTGWWTLERTGGNGAFREKIKDPEVSQTTVTPTTSTTERPSETSTWMTTEALTVTTTTPTATSTIMATTPIATPTTTQPVANNPSATVPSVPTTEIPVETTENQEITTTKDDSVSTVKTSDPDSFVQRDIEFFLTAENFDFRSNSRIAVEFNPLFDNASVIDLNRITTLLDRVSQRFKSISIRASDRLNILHLKTVLYKINNWNSLKEENNRLTVDLLLNPPAEQDAEDWITGITNITEGEIEKFLGSVQVTFSKDYNNTSLGYYLGTINRLQDRFKNSNFKVGVELPLYLCKEIDFVELFSRYSEIITFRNTSFSTGGRLGFKELKRCSKKANNKFGNKTEIVFNVGWNSTTQSGKKDYESFVQFWGDMRVWSNETNNKIVMTEAFESELDPGFGWWEVDKVSSKLTEKWYLLVSGFDEKAVGVNRSLVTFIQLLFPIQTVIETPPGSDGFSDDQWWYLVYCGAPSGCAVIAISIVVAGLLVARMKRNQGRLTKVEAEAFIQGTRSFGDNLGEEQYITSRYNGEVCEIPLQNIAFDSVLGSGKFSMVYKATVADRPVAVKVPKRGCPKQEFKLMLTELKIMARTGFHVNILTFHGAYTKDIRKGKVYIVSEFCEGGTLHSYLRTLRYNLEANETAKLENIADLYKFSSEIASGMDYLLEKDVIHGSLCTNSVLLDKNHVCKIYNYGLNCKLDQNGDYIRQKEDSFPWQWIALETLKHKIITNKSDTWSYGVALWEIFSLGRIPFKSVSQEGFLEKLEKGLRLKRPKYATQDVYDNMMQCWNKNPSERPQFKEQREYFVILMKEEDELTQIVDV